MWFTKACRYYINNKTSNAHLHPTTFFSALGPRTEHWSRAPQTQNPHLVFCLFSIQLECRREPWAVRSCAVVRWSVVRIITLTAFLVSEQGYPLTARNGMSAFHCIILLWRTHEWTVHWTYRDELQVCACVCVLARARAWRRYSPLWALVFLENIPSRFSNFFSTFSRTPWTGEICPRNLDTEPLWPTISMWIEKKLIMSFTICTIHFILLEDLRSILYIVCEDVDWVHLAQDRGQ
jgi:hypothetical protein